MHRSGVTGEEMSYGGSETQNTMPDTIGAYAAKFLEVLGPRESCQFVIPIYQRAYSWAEQECRQLWDDIIHVGMTDKRTAHFVGSIVHIAEGLRRPNGLSVFHVIDGQQRLTTLILIIEALARQLGDRKLPGVPSAKNLRDKYLLNPDEEGEGAFRLLLSQTDKASLIALVQQKSQPEDKQSLRIMENFVFIEEQIKELGDDLPVLYKGLRKLVVVGIALSQGGDNPQLIFESMNSTGRELSQADLIRNFVLMGLEHRHQTQLYKDHWRPMEERFGQEGYGSHFDSFMRHYLTLKTREIPNVRGVYDAFKIYARKPEIAAKGIDALVEDIHTFAGYYCAMALDKETNKKLAKSFQDLRELKAAVAYPFLLELYDDFANGRLEVEDFESAVRLIESYVFRRAVCALPTNSLNKTFATFWNALHKDERYLESIQAHLLMLPSYRRFPKNDEFKDDLIKRDLYHFSRCSYCLRRMENYDTKEPVLSVDGYTIEHILPQNENLSPRWREELGPEWQDIREKWLHTLGNLTLTGYNTEYSDQPFATKRDMKGGFKESHVRLNGDLRYLDKWDKDAIKTRAERLAQMAIDIWAMPSLQTEVLESYHPKGEKESGYTINDHTNLVQNAPMGELFEVFRKQLLALDPCVTEEFLKYYVAYKAETNFVDIVPQKKRLRLSLNMRFHDLHDPKGLAKDITSIGRWGNGDVEVGLSKINEISYVMGLVRQAFEKQMGNDEDDE